MPQASLALHQAAVEQCSMGNRNRLFGICIFDEEMDEDSNFAAAQSMVFVFAYHIFEL